MLKAGRAGAWPLVVICGPTAVGKTAAAISLAERIGGEIVAADSRTVYRRMDIGTAKPTPQQRLRVPHHVLDIADADQIVTAAVYRQLALAAITQIREAGRAPLLVGGTGLYIRAVVDGFAIPEVPPDWSLRQRLEENERRAPGTLHRRLQSVDPIASARIHPRNVRRIIRALEVCEQTGQPISSLRRRVDPIGDAVQIGLTMDRGELYRHIDTRVDEQIRRGLVDEVKQLLVLGYDRSLPALQGLGYKELIGYLDGAVPLEEAVRRLKRNTRRYAKRQYTWFRRDDRIRWLDVTGQSPEEVAAAIRVMIK